MNHYNVFILYDDDDAKYYAIPSDYEKVVDLTIWKSSLIITENMIILYQISIAVELIEKMIYWLKIL